MKAHQVIALYTLIFAGALSVYFWQIIGLLWAWALLTSVLWQIASIGLFLKKKWAPPFTFALFGLALATTLAFGIVLMVRGTDPTMRGSFVFLGACVALFLPLRLLNSRKVRETFGFRIHDPETEHQTTENEQA